MDKKEQENKLLDSCYDGIQEYDNDLPRWWVWLFYLTIIFAVGYVWYYHLGGPGQKLTAILEDEMQALEQQRQSAAVNAGVPVTVSLVAAIAEPGRVEKGAKVFTERCAPCHGAQGQGIVGPNLTDKFWIHGASPEDVKKIIEQGVLEKGMLAWKGIITDDDIINLVAHIRAIGGTNPPNPKAPEGIEAKG